MNDPNALLAGLNAEQLQAVTYTDGSLLVLAGAGSGKTKVLTTRMAWLIRAGHLAAYEFLAVTFTNKAAREMLQRLGKLLAIDTRYLWVGTFHSLALRLLRLHHSEAGLNPNFQILDAADQQNLIKRLIKFQQLDEERYPVREVQSFINAQKEQGLRAKQVVCHGLRAREWCAFYALYEEVCQRDSLLDFTELLLRSYEMLRQHAHLLDRYRQQFKQILVDEFQDTNQLQYQWLQLLLGEQSTIFAVGDDDQSIYSFRGAKVSNMRAFLTDFQVANPLRLEQNYRSTPTILAAANAIIENNSERIGKQLWTTNQHADKIRLYEGYTEEDEAMFVVNEIYNLHNNGVELSDIAILYRSNAQSRVFEQQLYNRGLAYKVYGGLRFFDRMEIKRVLAYLRLIVNPHDNEAFLRVVNFPARGIGPKTIETLQELAVANRVSLFSAAEFLNGKSRASVEKFIVLIQMMQQEAQILNLAEVISYIIEVSGIRAHFAADQNDGEERLENLNELITAVASYQPLDSSNPLSDFLAHAVLESVDNQANVEQAAVQLMTVHAAKGLEFKVVFIVGLEDGLFPHENSIKAHNGIEEERRLMYVAVTRAREKLFLLRACSRLLWGKRLAAPISRFVNEIPDDLILNISGVSKVGYWPQTAPASPTMPGSAVQAGDMVHHAKFGNGRVLRISGEGQKVTADIFFIGLGKKTLDLSIAKIAKVG